MSSAGGHARLDLAQKGDEVLRAMLRLTPRRHFAGRNVERGEQIERAVADVVMRPSFGLTQVHRQDRLRALQRLNLRLLVDGKDGGVVRRVHVETDHIAHLLNQLRIRRELESPREMRLEPERAPDAPDHRVTQAGRRRHRPGAPVRRPRRLGLERLHDDRFTAASVTVRGAPTRGSS